MGSSGDRATGGRAEGGGEPAVQQIGASGQGSRIV
jgi:hypothetical protein